MATSFFTAKVWPIIVKSNGRFQKLWLGLCLCDTLLTLHLLSPFCVPFWKYLIVAWVPVQDLRREQLCGAKETKENKPNKISDGFCLQSLGPGSKWLFPCGMSLPRGGLHYASYCSQPWDTSKQQSHSAGTCPVETLPSGFWDRCDIAC